MKKTLLLLALGLSACGQSGDLYLPEEAPADAASAPSATPPAESADPNDEEQP